MQALIKALEQKQGGKTLEEFGRELGVHHSTLSRIYRGERGIGIHTLKRIEAKYPDLAPLFFVSEGANRN